MDPKKVLSQALVDKGATELDPLKNASTADKQTMGEIQTLVDDFVTYRATEAEETAGDIRNSLEILGHRLPCLLLHWLWSDA